MNGLRKAASLAILTLGATAMLAVAIPTLGLARRLYSEVIGRAIGDAILRVWRIRWRVHRLGDAPAGQVVYVSNHTSSLDPLLLIALALPRTRFFMSGYLRALVPLGVIGYLIRIFWTVPQEHPEQRRRIFQRAARVLRRTGDSVYLSPEGMRVTGGGVGHFNKGSFHLATSLGAPIVPLYIRIPAETDPGRSYDAAPGLVDVYVLPPIDTSHWTVDEVPHRRDQVRSLYVRVHEAMRATGRPPSDLTLPPLANAREEVAV